jgi:predicted metalloprotease
MHFPAEEIADLGFFDRLPANATPSPKFFEETFLNHIVSHHISTDLGHTLR